MNELNEKIFLIKANNKLDFKNHFNELIEFQINHMSNFNFGTIWIFDPEHILKKNHFNYEHIVHSINELKDWCKTSANNKQIFLIDSVNPFLDIELVEHLSTYFLNSNFNGIIVDGAIPGTSPDLLTSSNYLFEYLSLNNKWPNDLLKNVQIFYCDTQRIHNAQFDLNKSHRIKIFTKLILKISSLHTLSLTEFIKKLNEDDIFNFIIDYAVEGLETQEIRSCPYCNSKNLKPLYLSTSQTWLGFISNLKPLYYECLECSLVVFRKQCKKTDVQFFYDEYERADTDAEPLIEGYKKHVGSHFEEKRKALDKIESLLPTDASVIDLGGGFGEFACFEKFRNPKWNVNCADFNLTPVQELLDKRQVQSINVNFLENDFGKDYDLITMWQAIEHVPFEGIMPFFEHVKESLRDGGYFVLATPDYDSPFCKLFDYHLMYPPQHQTILSSKWLEQFVIENNLFKVVGRESAYLPLELYEDWFSYYKKTSPNHQTSSLVEIFDMIHQNKTLFKSFEENISERKLGSEVILFLQK
jgi:2-polyprenyl-3-methyl-5-hydroxy-6-metoxy-1,4-benzoquinol methylase